METEVGFAGSGCTLGVGNGRGCGFSGAVVDPCDELGPIDSCDDPCPDTDLLDAPLMEKLRSGELLGRAFFVDGGVRRGRE